MLGFPLIALQDHEVGMVVLDVGLIMTISVSVTITCHD